MHPESNVDHHDRSENLPKPTESKAKPTRINTPIQEGDNSIQRNGAPVISNPRNALEKMIVKKCQGRKLARPKVSTKPDFLNDNSLLARIAREQQTKKKMKKPNVSAPIILDQSLSSKDKDNWPRIANVRTSYHLLTQYNLLPAANVTAMISSSVPKSQKFAAMISSHAEKELPLFSGQLNEDLLDWIEQFEKAFNVAEVMSLIQTNGIKQKHIYSSLYLENPSIAGL